MTLTTKELLLIRLQNITKKESVEEAEADVGFPLHLLLLLLKKFPGTLEYPHFQGFKLLYNWLSPIALPTQDSIKEIPFWVYKLHNNSYTLSVVAAYFKLPQPVIVALDMYISGTDIWTPQYPHTKL